MLVSMSKSVPLVGEGPFDAAIIRAFSAGDTAEEVSREVGGMMTPEECLSRLMDLIQSKDILDAKDRLALLIEDIYFLRNKLRKQMESSDYIDKDSAAIWLKTIQALVDRIDKVDASFLEAMMRMQEAHARVMSRAIEVGYEKALLELQKRYDIPREEAYLVLRESLPLAIAELERDL